MCMHASVDDQRSRPPSNHRHTQVRARSIPQIQTYTQLHIHTETHPAFKAEAGRAEEERGKKVEKARHMLELVRSNEEAALDVERKAANRTLEVRCRVGCMHGLVLVL